MPRPAPEEPETLFCRWRDQGDAPALAEVFDRLAPELLLLAAHLVRQAQDAEDVVQETFLAAIRGADSYDPARPLRPWLVGILSHRALRVQRQRLRQPDPERLSPAPAIDPVAAAECEELGGAVALAIQELKPQFREALTLHWIHGLSPTQIAQAKGIPPSTVKTRIHRARKALQAALPQSLTALALFATQTVALGQVRQAVLQEAGALPPAPIEADPARPTPTPGLGLSAKLSGLLLLGGLGLAWALELLPGGDGGARPRPQAATVDGGGAGARSTARGDAEQARERVPAASRADLDHVYVRFADGRPAADLAFRVLPLERANPALHARRGRSDGAGRIARADLPSGVVSLRPTLAGAFRFRAQTHDEVLRLPAGRRVSGEVRDAHGKPVAGARVLCVAATEPWIPAEVTQSDAAGRFALDYLGADRWLAAVAPGWAPSLLACPDADTGEVTLQLDHRGVPVTGRVRDADGQAIGGARVMLGLRPAPDAELTSQRPACFARSAADGSFRVEHVPQAPEAFLWARAPGYAARSGNITLERGRGADVDVVLDPGARIQGRVTDPAGRPVVGARLSFRDAVHDLPEVEIRPPDFARSSCVSGAGGHFVAEDLLATPLHALAEDPRRGLRRAAELRPGRGEELVWNPQLGLALVYTGLLRSARGAVLSGLSVHAAAPDPLRPPRPVRSDAAGRFQLQDLDDAVYLLWVRGPARTWPHVLAWRRAVRASSQTRTWTLAASQTPSARVKGRVKLPARARNTRLFAVLEDRGQRRCHAPVVDGSFGLGPVPAGSYRLRLAVSPGQYLWTGDWFELGPDAQHEAPAIGLPAFGRVRLDPSGHEDAEVYLALEDGSLAMDLRKDGRPQSVPVGRYRLVDRHHLGTEPWPLVEIRENREQSLVLRRSPTVPQALEIRAADRGDDLRLRYRLSKAGVLQRRWSGFWKRKANLTQAVTLHLPPGVYEITVEDQWGRRAQARLSPTDPPAAALPLELR